MYAGRFAQLSFSVFSWTVTFF